MSEVTLISGIGFTVYGEDYDKMPELAKFLANCKRKYEAYFMERPRGSNEDDDQAKDTDKVRHYVDVLVLLTESVLRDSVEIEDASVSMPDGDLPFESKEIRSPFFQKAFAGAIAEMQKVPAFAEQFVGFYHVQTGFRISFGSGDAKITTRKWYSERNECDPLIRAGGNDEDEECGKESDGPAGKKREREDDADDEDDEPNKTKKVDNDDDDE